MANLLGRRLDAKETILCWLDGYQSVSRLAQKRTGFTTVRNDTKSGGISQRLPERGAESEDFKERVEMAKVFCLASSH